MFGAEKGERIESSVRLSAEGVKRTNQKEETRANATKTTLKFLSSGAAKTLYKHAQSSD